ncbi:MAG: FmdB family transcriptional regulator [Phycisphaerales bacterium]|nr:FmdB family transcriptional regulator [Phycisphaerales bacterium]
MPTYVYQVITPAGDGRTFEVVQRMTDAPLTKHPETGEPVRRVPQAPMIAGEHTDAASKRKLSDKNLDRLGFTKYVKGDKGYEKTAGSGPDLLKRPAD